jgi:hypothetical protein
MFLSSRLDVQSTVHLTLLDAANTDINADEKSTVRQ